MKSLKLGFVIIICSIIGLGIGGFNLEPDSISEIDNRKLTTFPTIGEGDFTDSVENYVSDRIGFRTWAIDTFTWLNDKLFNEMVHPTYTYGKDGYVFFKLSDEEYDIEWLDGFVAFLLQLQTYCDERNIPFIFWLNPAKTTVYSNYLPDGYNFTGKFLRDLLQRLDEAGINYVNTTDVLMQKKESEQVFNVKYDAGHWNDLGAFYGTNAILDKISEFFPSVRSNTFDDFECLTSHVTSLSVSHFAIDEDVPVFLNTQSNSILSLADDYASLNLNANYTDYDVLINTAAQDEYPRVLFFQGSYVNGRRRFIESRIKEYDSIHNYENVLDFDYYFNIFQPDCVIFETAEYTLSASYFDYATMINCTFNPSLNQFDSYEEVQMNTDCIIGYEESGNIVNFSLENPWSSANYAYLQSGNLILDLKMDFEEYTLSASFDSTRFDSENAKLILLDEEAKEKRIYDVKWVSGS
ncbi:MAG: alginate O-acetyltransferase AlgX-related protein [Clostridia bacterium]